MGFWQALFGEKKKKFTVDELREVKSVIEDKDRVRNTRGTDDFFEQMRKYKEFERQMAADKEDEVQQILAKYGVAGEGEEGPSMESELFQALLPKLLGSNAPPNAALTTVHSPAGTEQPAGGVFTDEQINEMAGRVKMLVPKKIMPMVLGELKQIPDADLLKLKKKLLEAQA